MDPYNQFNPSEYKINGQLSSSMEIIGYLKQPEADIDININNFNINDNYIGDVYTQFSIVENKLSINEFNLKDSLGFHAEASGQTFLKTDSLKTKFEKL